MSGATGAGLSRAMTGKRLVRLLLRQGDLRFRFEDPELLPMSARPALGAIAALVARAGSGLEYRPPGGVEVARVVAHELGVAGWVRDARDAVEALARVGLVVIEDGAVRLPIDLDAPTATSSARVEANRRNALYTVRRSQGESDADYQRRKAAHRARVDAELRAQGTLLMPVAGGRSGADTGDASNPMAPHGGWPREAVGHPNLQPNNPTQPNGSVGMSLGYRAGRESPEIAAAAAAESRIESTTQAAAAAESVPDAYANGQPIGQANIPTQSGQGHPNFDGMASSEAAVLADEAAGRFGWAQSHAAEAPGLFDRALADGYTPAQIRAVVADKVAKGVSCRSARYLLQALGDQKPGQGGAGSGRAGESRGLPPPEVAAAPMPADLQRHPSFRSLEYADQSAARDLLAMIDQPGSLARPRSAADFRAQRWPRGFRLAAELRPALLDLVEPHRLEELGLLAPEPMREAG